MFFFLYTAIDSRRPRAGHLEAKGPTVALRCFLFCSCLFVCCCCFACCFLQSGISLFLILVFVFCCVQIIIQLSIIINVIDSNYSMMNRTCTVQYAELSPSLPNCSEIIEMKSCGRARTIVLF